MCVQCCHTLHSDRHRNADALDLFGDAANYGISLSITGLALRHLVLLWAYRSGDSNMQSVWLCSRNDVTGNCAVLLAAAGVSGTSQGWPDPLVAVAMGALALQGAWVITKSASRELAGARA